MDWVIDAQYRFHHVVEYTAGFCNHCIKLSPHIDKVSKEFTASKDRIKFARFDLNENDHDFIDIDHVPLVRFYPKGLADKAVDIRIYDENGGILSTDVITK